MTIRRQWALQTFFFTEFARQCVALPADITTCEETNDKFSLLSLLQVARNLASNMISYCKNMPLFSLGLHDSIH